MLECHRIVGLTGLLLATACGTRAELDVTPEIIEWGRVDFLEAMPTEGYELVELQLLNQGEANLEVSLTTFDFDHLCAVGYDASMMPAAIPTLEPEVVWTLFIGVCAYSSENGERDTEISGDIVLEASGKEAVVTVPWTFTPVLGLNDTGDDDTGDDDTGE